MCEPNISPAVTWRRLITKLVLRAVIFTNFAAGYSALAQTTLDFEDFTEGTIVTTQYGARGVVFPTGAYLDSDAAASSGSLVLRSDNPAEEFNSGPLVMTFTSKQSRVRMLAGTTLATPLNGTLKAYDEDGNLVAVDGPKSVSPLVFTTSFEVTVATSSIVKIELKFESTAFESIDDLEFEGEPPAPVPTDAPIVQITSPFNGAQIDLPSITIQGLVIGESLAPNLRITHTVGRPPGSLAPPTTNTVSLSGSGAIRAFTLTTLIGIGPHSMTVEAENLGALKGSAAVTFINLPEPIRDRYIADGGELTYGSLLYGEKRGGCGLAVYENGAVAAKASVTYQITGDVFSKWLSLTDAFGHPGRLGCPTSEQRTILGSIGQDFDKGRIYANLTTGAHYVPSAFVHAIDTLGGEEATGLPISDPTDSIGVMKTWLFQRFRRPSHPELLPSTLEIRGSPPRLWVERQGGDLSPELFKDVPITRNLPTISQSFPCSGPLGPCDLTVQDPEPPIEDAGEIFCNGTTYPWGAREWAAVSGDHVLTPLVGIVSSSHMAGSDNPWAHEFHEGPPNFRSDWNVFVRPLRPYSNLFANDRETIEVEVEYYYVRYFDVGWGLQIPGDLMFTSGRWIVDCGHSSYNAEIHPPSVMAHMRTVDHAGWPATRANIWVGGFYPGGPVEFDIFPPPRPSPNAVLYVEKPLDDDAAVGLNVSFTIPESSYVRVRFTASPRSVPVDADTGEMKWQSGRAYYGRWHVLWTE